MNRRKCVDLGHGIYELKEWNWRVLWFYDAGEPKHRKRIICTHSSGKVAKKEFQPEIQRARRMREEYMKAKASGHLIEPDKPEVRP
jgi:site-specific DNA-cytosine methylase